MNLRDIIKELNSDNEELYSIIGKVKKVNDDNTIDVSPISGEADILSVRLIADDSTKGFIITPVINSIVIVSFLSKEEAFISMFSKIDTYQIKNDKEDLKQLLSDIIKQINSLIDATSQITVTGNLGVATSPPINSVAIEAIKVQTELIDKRLDLLFK